MADAFNKGSTSSSPTVPWGADTTVHAGEPAMTGAQFNAIREKANAERADLHAQGFADLFSVLANAGVPKVAAQAIAQEIQELKNQVSLLRGLPPFMKDVEQR
jgi:hypothetical protein